MKTSFKLIPILLTAVLLASCTGAAVITTLGQPTTTLPPVTSTNPPQVSTPTPTSTSVQPTTALPPVIITTPPVTTTPPQVTTPPTTSTITPTATTVPPSTTVTFDFDTGSPALMPFMSSPLDQTSNGVTARFSSSYDPAAFSIQSYDTTYYKLTQFSGNFLSDNNPARNPLEITFSQQLSSIKLTFATADSHGPGNVELPTEMKLIAYKDTAGTTPVGTATARAAYLGDTFPQGVLSFDSGGKPVNLVVIEIIVSTAGGIRFLCGQCNSCYSNVATVRDTPL